MTELQCHASHDIEELRTEIGELKGREEQSAEISRLKKGSRWLQSRAWELLCASSQQLEEEATSQRIPSPKAKGSED